MASPDPAAQLRFTTFVDVYVLQRQGDDWLTLVLRRAAGTRCRGAWEAVHGRVEAGEAPVEAGRRELREETGLVPDRFYNLSRVESFHLHRTGEIAVIPAFAALVHRGHRVVLSAEHDRFEWMPVEQAVHRFAWPRERRAIADAVVLLAGGDAGPLEDVLLV